MPNLSPLELLVICLICLFSVALPFALLMGLVYLYERIVRIERRLAQGDSREE